jgi:glycosyltransferase involved in cell wall biosynthesis
VKPRILFVANARLPTEKAHGHAIVKMCEAYARIGLDVELWYPRRRQPSDRLRDATVFDYYDVPESFRTRALPNVDVVAAESWLPRRLFRELARAHDLVWAWSVARRAARERFDIHHTRNAAVALCLARAGLPTVLETHSPPAGARRRLIRRVAQLPHLQLAIALTDACRQSLLALGVPDDKIIVLGSCVDLSSYADLPSVDECRDELGLPRNRLIVGYVGRFQTVGMEKGIPTLVQAIGRLRVEHGIDPVLVCVGGPMDPVPRYLAIAAAARIPSEDLHLVDHVASSDVPKWIRATDVGVIPFPSSPSRFARFASPLKAFEFQAAGVPILASDLPSMREALTHGENAWLVEPDDPDALAAGLARLLTDEQLRTTLGARGRLAVTEHTWVRRAERIRARFGGSPGAEQQVTAAATGRKGSAAS